MSDLSTHTCSTSLEFREMTEEDQKNFHPVPCLTDAGITPEYIREQFNASLLYVRDHLDQFVTSPGTDFTRKSWFDSVSLMKFMILMGGGSSVNELCTFFGIDEYENAPHSSTFCMARRKLLPEALEAVFHHFTNSIAGLKTFHGYRLVAVDGSTINIPLNKNEPETLHQNKEDQKYFNQCYFNGAYDLLNAIYVDVVISTLSKTDERSALLEMAARSMIYNALFIGDRGYGGWKVFATLEESGKKFIIREKDKDSQGIFRSLNLSNEAEFDIVKTVILTNRQTNETRNHPEVFRIIMSNQDFPYLDKENHYYALKLRFVRKKVAPDKYICVITNLLDQNEFTSDDIQYVYFLRWGQEGSYRIFKYTIGVLQFHCRKYVYARQELYAKMILFNACQLIAGCVPMDDNSNNSRVLTKEEYLETCQALNEIAESEEEAEDKTAKSAAGINPGKTIRLKPNISAAVTNIKQYLSGKGTESRIIARIKRYLIPIRPGRSYGRNIKSQSATTLLYRVA